MSDVKRLLAEATPLPWIVRESDGYLTDAEGDLVHWDTEGLGAIWAEDANPHLIQYAVNHLPDYEAAVEALDRIFARYKRHVPYAVQALHRDVIEEARAALARLREKVPA